VTEQPRNEEFPQPEIELRESPDSFELSIVMPAGVQIEEPDFAAENRVLMIQFQAQESTAQEPENFLLKVELPEPVDVTKSDGEWASTWLHIESPKIKVEQPTRSKPTRALRNSSLDKPPASKSPLATGRINSNLSQLPGESGIDDLP
jgi:HSP20 family molecular chaperone IbpA